MGRPCAATVAGADRPCPSRWRGHDEQAEQGRRDQRAATPAGPPRHDGERAAQVGAMSATSELQRRAELSVGDLVFYDSIRSGRVPCRVIGTKPHLFATDDELYGSLLVLKVTGAR